jgi:DnaJ-domain-containing protein 1
MTDNFALLDEQRRPWLEPEALKSKFLARSATVHPDRVHHLGDAERQAAHARYTELNAAYNCLRENRDRLRHLLELETGGISRDVTRMPAGLMDLFVEIGEACREADGLLSEKAKLESPLLKARFFARGQQSADKLMRLQRGVNGRLEELTRELKELDSRWPVDSLPESPERPVLLEQIEDLYRRFSFYQRWGAQLQERIVGLAV